MKTYTSIPKDLPPTALTIGTFDGVHIGHQALLKRLKSLGSQVTVVTFTNHPLEVLNPAKAPKPLIPLADKLALLEASGVDILIALPFTREIANQSYEAFLAHFPLTHLILGAGDALGKGREGTPENLAKLGLKRGFKLEYLEKVILDGEPISSRRIRACIAGGDLETASRLLGRPYAI